MGCVPSRSLFEEVACEASACLCLPLDSAPLLSGVEAQQRHACVLVDRHILMYVVLDSSEMLEDLGSRDCYAM